MKTTDILRSNKDKILDSWLHKVRSEIPVANNYEKTIIQNNVPNMLDAIADVLEKDDIQPVISFSEQHGLERAQYQAYSLKHIIQEYNLLKKVIFEVVDSYSDVTERRDRDIIMKAIDYAVEQAAEVFFREKQDVQLKARSIAEQKADQLKVEDEHREEFIQSIMHDLNSPLNNIKACISMLEGNIEVNEAKKVLEILKLSSQQAELLIEDFLDVGFVKSDEKLPVQKNVVNVLEDIHQQVKIFRITYKREILMESDREEIYWNVDIDLVRRAFNNLINNAIKHGESSKAINVACHLQDGQLLISVKNQGRIIPRKTIDEIFNRYYKLNESTGGWGIGLAFVKKVAEAHGGDISVESSDPGGTRFTLKLPEDRH